MALKLAMRDLVILGVTLALWSLDATRNGGDVGVVSGSIAVAAGAMATLCGYLAHEWGHLFGARAGGSVVHWPDRLGAVFLFQFDPKRNGRREFLMMSCGGFAASAAVIALFLEVLPRHNLAGRVALTLTLVGVAATIVLELPAAWRVWRGAPLPTGAAYRTSSEGGATA